MVERTYRACGLVKTKARSFRRRCSTACGTGEKDIFIGCTDDLIGADAAVHATFLRAEIQNCIIHQSRNSSKYALQLYTLC